MVLDCPYFIALDDTKLQMVYPGAHASAVKFAYLWHRNY